MKSAYKSKMNRKVVWGFLGFSLGVFFSYESAYRNVEAKLTEDKEIHFNILQEQALRLTRENQILMEKNLTSLYLEFSPNNANLQYTVSKNDFVRDDSITENLENRGFSD